MDISAKYQSIVKLPLEEKFAIFLLPLIVPMEIPCITWGRNALYTSGLDVGSRVKLYGRIQSREYTKNLSDTETETRTAYEVSVSKIELVEEN